MPRNRYYQGPLSDHFDGLHFFNPGQTNPNKSFSDLLRWRWDSRRLPPWRNAPRTQVSTPVARSQHPIVTMIGHSSVLIQIAGLNLLVDPVWSERASPLSWLGPRRWNSPGIAFSALPPIDYVLITHNHYDHLDLPTLARLQMTHAPRVVTPLGNNAIIRKHVPNMRVHTLDWWHSMQLADDHAKISVVPAYHWSARGIRDRRMALWGGFYLHTSKGNLYIAGDTAYGDGSFFQAIAKRCGTPDLAILPIGAYAPRWFMHNQHVDAVEAVQIMCDVGAHQALGVHWGTFRLTDEAAEEPPALLAQALQAQNMAATCFIAMTPGQRWTGTAEDSQASSPTPPAIPHAALMAGTL
ncbi:MAG TPA: MBL fold metallo-hydrolase [Xylella taiwanensis]